MSSGTIGAAMSSALSQVRSIAISYGTVLHPTPSELFEPAHALSLRIVQYLWNNWGKDIGGMRNEEIDLYNVNIPMIMELLEPEGLEIHWTHMWRNSYGQLFKAVSAPEAGSTKREPPSEGADVPSQRSGGQSGLENGALKEEPATLLFKFSPDVRSLITPAPHSVPVGSDGWAIAKGYASITPLRACFAHVYHDHATTGTESPRILKL